MVVVPQASEVPHLMWPRLADLLRDPNTFGGLGSLAGLARPSQIDKPFNVGAVSGSVGPIFVATADVPGREEIGLLGPVTVRLSLQRVVTVTVQTDAGPLVSEQNAVGGVKKVDRWAPFDSQAQVVINNPSSTFYVVGQVFAPVWYVKRVLFDTLRSELVALLPAPNAEATGVV